MRYIKYLNRFSWKELMSGNSLNRVIRDTLLKHEVLLHGRILDIGGGHMPYYWKYFPDCEFISADSTVQRDIDIQVDLENPLPVESETFDGILCLSVLEHIWNYRQIIRESLRIKKHNAPVYYWIPFFIQPHGTGYGDFFRFTGPALERLFAECKFSSVEVLAPSNFFWVIGNLISQKLYIRRFLKPVTIFSNYLFMLLARIFKGGDWPIGYLVIAY